MEGKSYHYLFLFIGLVLCLLHNVNGETSRCTVRKLLKGGFVPDGKIEYNHGENMTFYCNARYAKEHDTRYWCDSGYPVPSIPRCITARPCNAPFLPAHMTLSRSRFQHGTLLDVSCEHGFELRMDQELPRCHGGAWSQPLTATCQRASCSAPDLPDHMTPSRFRFPHGMLLGVSCEHGFQLSTSQELPRCLQGAWSPPLTATCQRVPCEDPMRSPHSTIEILPGVQGNVHGTRVRYSCSDGWEIEGTAERECDNGQWTGLTPECRVLGPPRCMLPERSRGERYSITGFAGNIFDEGLPIGERVSISVRCNQGYTPQPAVQTTCLDVERGSWSVAVPICVRIERLCSKPGYISHVVQYVNGLETNKLATYPHDELPEGTFLVSRCSLPGEYVLHGSANRTCFDGGWTGEEPRCVNAATRISFQHNQPLEVRSNGTIVIHPRGQVYIYCRMPYYSYASARFESDNGPTAEYWYSTGISTRIINLDPPLTSHSGRFTCRSRDNTLSHTVDVQVAEIYCNEPTAPTNGEIQDYDTGWRHELYYMGKLITFTCNDDYTLNGARRMTCVFGEWSHPVPTCKRATCEELRPPTHGTRMGGNRVGDSVLIGCYQGYQLQGEPFLDCQESGNWSHPLPACVEIVEPERPCDSVICEVWQKCETDSSGVGVCRCIGPNSCPVTDEPEVCGTDGRNYTNLCRLMSFACIRNTGVEEASSNRPCIDGVPERVLPSPTPFIESDEPSSFESSYDGVPERVLPSPTPFIEIDEPSSFVSFYEESPPSIPEPTLLANEGLVLEPGTPSSRPYPSCHPDVCSSSSTAALCQNATAIVIAYPKEWDAHLGILRIQIYEMMAGELPSWTNGSYQDVVMDVSAASERGCLCPSFPTADPVIIRFSQNLTLDGKGQLLHTDIVLLYSRDLYGEILRLLEAPEPVHEQTPGI